MANEQKKVRDEHYDLLSVAYHALQSYHTLKKYEEDARGAGKEELADFFCKIQEEDLERAERVKSYLRDWIQGESKKQEAGESAA